MPFWSGYPMGPKYEEVYTQHKEDLSKQLPDRVK